MPINISLWNNTSFFFLTQIDLALSQTNGNATSTGEVREFVDNDASDEYYSDEEDKPKKLQ